MFLRIWWKMLGKVAMKAKPWAHVKMLTLGIEIKRLQ